MRRSFLVVATSLSLMLTAPSAAHAAIPRGYGVQATAVAKAIGCVNLSHKSGDSTLTHSGLVCQLSGYRINIITFRNAGQQKKWIDLVPSAFSGDAYVATANGVVSVAKNGNQNAAKVAAKALHATVVKV